MNDMRVNGAASARIAAGPPSSPAGKNLTSSRPSDTAVISSLAVATPGQRGDAAGPAPRDDVDRQAGADDEPGPGVDDLVDLVGDQHGTGADMHAGQPGQPADRLEPRVGAQGDLDDVDPAGEQRLAERHGLVGVVEHDHRDDRAPAQQGRAV